MHTRSIIITPVAPFDFDKSLQFIQGFGPTEGDQASSGKRLLRAMRADGQLLGLEVTSSGTVDAPRLTCVVHAREPISDSTLGQARHRAEHFLSVHDDLNPLYQRAHEDPPFLTRVKRWYGLHQPCFFSPFEIAAWAVLTQRTPIPLARRLKRSLVETFGDVVELHGEQLPVFPDARTIAAIPVEKLARHVGTERKADYLHSVATAFSDVDEAWLRSAPVDEVVAWLKDIRGLGEWSSSFVALRGLGRTEWLPVAMARVLEPAQRLYGRSMTTSQAQQIADGYGALKGYWALYIRAGAAA